MPFLLEEETSFCTEVFFSPLLLQKSIGIFFITVRSFR